jgi:gliding motility-associated-like protein
VWTVVSGTATFVDAQQANTSISGLSAGTNVLRWTIGNGVCSPSADEVTILVEQSITEPDAGPDQTICGNTAVLSASPASGGTWSIVSGSGTFANPQNPNSSISGLGSGLNVFRWTVQSGVCPSLSDDVSITVSISPTTADAGPNQTLCSASTVLAANTPSTGNGQWSVISGSGFFSNASQANSTVSGMGPGLNVFRWTISNGICPPSIDDVQVTVLSAPVAFAGQDQSVCGSSTVLEASAAQAGIGTWTVVSGGASFADSQSATSAVSALLPGVNVLRWTVVNGSCPAAFDEVTIQSFVQVNQPDAGLDQTICSTETQLNASVPPSGQGVWSVVSGAGLIADPTNPLTSVSSLLSGANVFRFTVSNGICPPVSDEITVTVLSQPQANAGVDFGVCAGSASLAASLPAGAGGQWQLISGSAFIQNISSPTTLVSNLGIGQNVFLWTVSNGVCNPATDQITLTRFEEPSPANAGNDFQTCATAAQLNAQQPTVGTGFWSVLSGNGNFSNPTLPNSGVSQLAVGANVLLWTVSNGACPATSDEIVITVDQNPTSADAGSDQSLCTDQTVLDATQPSAGTGVWTVLSGTAAISNPGSASSTVSALGQGSTTLRWTVTNGTCVSFDDVQIIRSLPPSSAIAGEDRQVCTDTVHLQANTPLIGSGSWSVLSGSASVQNLNSPNTTVTSLSSGANVFVWTISNGACEPSADQVTVIRQTPPDVANAGANQQICEESTTLSANLPLVGTGIWSIISGSATIENAFNPNTAISGLSPGQNVLRWTTLNGICPASNDDVEVFRATPPSPAAAGEDALVCGTTASLNAEIPSSGSGAWVLIAGTAQIDDENDPQTGLSNLLPGTVRLVWQVSSSPCPLNADTVQLTVASQTPQANAGIDIETCSNSTLLFGNNTAGGLPLWTLISGDLNIVNPSGQITNVNSIEPGLNILEYSISNAHCISRDTIYIIRYISEPFVFAGNDTTVCQEELQLQGSEANFGIGIWEILSGEASIDDTGTGQAMLSFISDTVSLSWTVGNNFCPLIADTVVLIRQTPTETALAMDDATICGTEILIEASPAFAGNGWWVIIAGDGVIEDTASASTTLFSQSTGEFIIAWVLQEGACLSADTVNLVSEEPPFPVYAGEDQQLCGNSTQLNASAPELGNGFWSTLSGGFFSDPNDPQSGFITPNSGFRALVWNVSNGACTLRDTVFIDMIEAPNADAGADLTGCLGDTVYLQAEIPDFGDGLWTLLSAGAQVFEPAFQNSGFVADSAGNYYLRWKVVNGICADSTILTITMLEADHPDCIGSSDNVFVPEGFSPNGDGVFDQFVIVHNPEKQIEFKVYDRRGVLIYQSMDYQNNWSGESEEGTILIDGKLPEGTYFYLLKVEGDFEYRKGYFTLWR